MAAGGCWLLVCHVRKCPRSLLHAVWGLSFCGHRPPCLAGSPCSLVTPPFPVHRSFPIPPTSRLPDPYRASVGGFGLWCEVRASIVRSSVWCSAAPPPAPPAPPFFCLAPSGPSAGQQAILRVRIRVKKSRRTREKRRVVGGGGGKRRAEGGESSRRPPGRPPDDSRQHKAQSHAAAHSAGGRARSAYGARQGGKAGRIKDA